jgi:hypothetical protein
MNAVQQRVFAERFLDTIHRACAQGGLLPLAESRVDFLRLKGMVAHNPTPRPLGGSSSAGFGLIDFPYVTASGESTAAAKAQNHWPFDLDRFFGPYAVSSTGTIWQLAHQPLPPRSCVNSGRSSKSTQRVRPS